MSTPVTGEGHLFSGPPSWLGRSITRWGVFKMWVLGQSSPPLHTYTTGGIIWWLEVLVSSYGRWP